MEIKDLFLSESSETEYKESLELLKPKSWLKTVSAFANGSGGIIYFGINDDQNITGLLDIQKDSDKISNLIKTKIEPFVKFELEPLSIESKSIIRLTIMANTITPYYYVNEGTKAAYVRIGNESVIAPSYLLNELILKGQKLSFDSLRTNIKFSDASFTLFKATYKKAVRKSIDSKREFLSFGMIDEDDYLTYAGLLLSDDCSLLQSRIFCTRWQGRKRGSISLDALDDKEYNGNIINLLRDACSFIKNNSRKSWKIDGLTRIEYVDYPEDAVREAVVNALVHRDYSIIGSEIHIEIYDDRLEIVSPGGMYNGRRIQELNIDQVASIRRNPIIADIFNRLDFMERRGSGLRRILEEYDDPALVDFYSDQDNFFVILKNRFPGNSKLQDGDSKLQDGDSKLQDGDSKLQDEIILKENILNEFGNIIIKDRTLNYIVQLFYTYNKSTFGRQNISRELTISLDRASQLIRQMMDINLIEKAEGRGQYKFAEDWSRKIIKD